jgi:hypothetical protein
VVPRQVSYASVGRTRGLRAWRPVDDICVGVSGEELERRQEGVRTRHRVLILVDHVLMHAHHDCLSTLAGIQV